MINKQNIRSMLENIVEIVNKDPIGADVKVALFISAAISFKNNSLLHPFPKEYINADKIKDFQRLVFDLEKIPNFEELITLSMGGNASLLPYPSIDLLYHILSWPKYNLESIKKPEFDKILCLSQINTNIRQKIPKPNHIFKVKYSESGAELKFISKKVGMETSYAFHGTRFFNIYSILNHGLQQHLNKIGLFGEGLYLAKEPDVSLLFSPSVLSWDKSLIGGLVSSIALCEYINDPSHVKVRKGHLKMQVVYITYVALLIHLTAGSETKTFQLTMPNVRPYRPELYLCTPVKVDYTRNYYMTAFQPNATMKTAHHMLLYGCGEVGSSKPVWNCGEMSQENPEEESGSPCEAGSHSQIIYAWARDAPKLNLPDGVGFKIGKSSPIKYLVLQVHYMHKFEEGRTDDSGIFIHYTSEPLRKLAGVLLLGTSGVIPPMKKEYMETACEITENKTIYPFAYRTHTHSLGKVVSGYRVRKDEEGIDHWTLLGKRDPLTPQMFYPTLSNDAITQGDKVAARCTMVSERKRITKIGATNEDEMCNFYLMYYVEDDEPMDIKYCYTAGPPYYSWKTSSDPHLNHIPDDEASQL
ncbi:CLUMA_CG020999, isoform A [Clunio marinus]|uniref:peptidylglycine monooxygenase n=1 Tax=Clunio marinus TaxID=568069 RepID=A0A1J1J7B5_9DIPT|nr:CLUMA_CG020999, isoform A [Clunio marinus]